GAGGHAILGELYEVPMARLHGLLAREPPELELSIVELAAGDPAGSSRTPGEPAPGEPGAGELSFSMVLRHGEDTRGRHADISHRGGGRGHRGVAAPPAGEAGRPGGPPRVRKQGLAADTRWGEAVARAES